jgi:hypothetical protein
LVGDQNTKSRFINNKSGYRIATSTGGTVLGDGANYLPTYFSTPPSTATYISVGIDNSTGAPTLANYLGKLNIATYNDNRQSLYIRQYGTSNANFINCCSNLLFIKKEMKLNLFKV